MRISPVSVEFVAGRQGATFLGGSADGAFVFGFETFVVAVFEVFCDGVGVVGGDVRGVVRWAVGRCAVGVEGFGDWEQVSVRSAQVRSGPVQGMDGTVRTVLLEGGRRPTFGLLRHAKCSTQLRGIPMPDCCRERANVSHSRGKTSTR